MLYNSWEATKFAVNEKGGRLADLAAEIGAELFVADDGWFVGRHDDRAGLGDWTVDLAKFPGGLGPLVDRVTKLGMGFGIWVEPEMVSPDSDLYRSHPDWVFHFPNRSRTESRNQLVLNLARDDVADWVLATVDRLLSDHNISFVKWDMNRPFSEPGWPEMVGGNPERAWVDHVHNLYDVLDRLRAAHPQVAIESCSGGGGRADIGILSRTEQVWTSDNTDAWDRVAIQEGSPTRMPPSPWWPGSPTAPTRSQAAACRCATASMWLCRARSPSVAISSSGRRPSWPRPSPWSLSTRRSGRPCNTDVLPVVEHPVGLGAAPVRKPRWDGRRCAGMDRRAPISAYSSAPPGSPCGPRTCRPLPGPRD